MVAYEDCEREHVAVIKGDLSTEDPVLCRIHSECLTGDVFGSNRCDCGPQLQLALETIEQAGRGIVLYLRQEGRGIGLSNKLRAYTLQDQGIDTYDANVALGFPADLRDYDIAAAILHDLRVTSVILMTNNPEKVQGLEAAGIHVAERLKHFIEPHEHNERYLQTKRDKMGHLF